MINRNVELREMDHGDVGSTNWSNQTISKGMASKTILYKPEMSGHACPMFVHARVRCPCPLTFGINLNSALVLTWSKFKSVKIVVRCPWLNIDLEL